MRSCGESLRVHATTSAVASEYYGTCKGYCCGVWLSVAETCEPVVCWPRHKICHVLNFCAGRLVRTTAGTRPGRFHPVPTHPVFAPAPEANELVPSRVAGRREPRNFVAGIASAVASLADAICRCSRAKVAGT